MTRFPDDRPRGLCHKALANGESRFCKVIEFVEMKLGKNNEKRLKEKKKEKEERKGVGFELTDWL